MNNKEIFIKKGAKKKTGVRKMKKISVFGIVSILVCLILLLSACQSKEASTEEELNINLKDRVSFHPSGIEGNGIISFDTSEIILEVKSQQLEEVKLHMLDKEIKVNVGEESFTGAVALPQEGEIYTVTIEAIDINGKVHTVTMDVAYGEKKAYQLLQKDYQIVEAMNQIEGAVALGWADNKIYGYTSAYSPEKRLVVKELGGAFHDTLITTKEASVSPDGRLAAYYENNALQIKVLGSIEENKVWPIQREDWDNLWNREGSLWSPDSKKLLFWIQHEWDAEYFIADIEKNTVTPIKTTLGQYYSTTALGWADNNNIIFTAVSAAPKDGQEEYGGNYRWDLTAYHVNDNRYIQLSQARDGEYYQGLSLSPQGVLYRYHEEENENQHFGLMDMKGRILWQKPFKGLKMAAMDANGEKLAYLAENPDVLPEEEFLNFILYIEAAGETRPVLKIDAGYEDINTLVWSHEGSQLLLSFQYDHEKGGHRRPGIKSQNYIITNPNW